MDPLNSEIVDTAKEHFTKLIIGSMSTVAAFAWHEAVKNGINKCYPAKKDTVGAKFVYAFLVTCAFVGIVYMLEN